MPVICFPRGIKDYKNFCNIVKPDAINIDYDVDPNKIIKEINSWYLPNKIIMYNNRPFSHYTKNENLKLSIYLCRNNVCNETIHSVNNLKKTITLNKFGY